MSDVGREHLPSLRVELAVQLGCGNRVCPSWCTLGVQRTFSLSARRWPWGNHLALDRVLVTALAWGIGECGSHPSDVSRAHAGMGMCLSPEGIGWPVLAGAPRGSTTAVFFLWMFWQT